jgi:hypothetical protein
MRSTSSSVLPTSSTDETGLFWRQLPSRTLGRGCQAGKKLIKQRVTLGLACNADGTEKLVRLTNIYIYIESEKPVVIGTAGRPRCFPRKYRVRMKLGMRYSWNSKAWMLATIFSKWVKQLNTQFSEQKHPCVLLVDNSSTHKVEDAELQVCFLLCVCLCEEAACTSLQTLGCI